MTEQLDAKAGSSTLLCESDGAIYDIHTDSLNSSQAIATTNFTNLNASSNQGVSLGSVGMDRYMVSSASTQSFSSVFSTASRPKKDELEVRNELGPKYVLCLVGLPARGKSYISRKLCRYLSWCGFKTRVFNVGNRRRVKATDVSDGQVVPPTPMDTPARVLNFGGSPSPNGPLASSLPSVPENEHSPPMTLLQPSDPNMSSPIRPPSNETHSHHHHHHKPPTVHLRPIPRGVLNSPAIQAQPGTTPHDASFFDASNQSATELRERLAMETLEEAISWLKSGGKVAIHDATNTTIARRQTLLKRLQKEQGIKILFIESICTDEELLRMNINMKLQGPDYQAMDPVEAERDFRMRIANYEKVYEPIGKEEEDLGVSFIKIINVGRKVIGHMIHGFVPSQCVFYLMQIHIQKRTIWLTRHGESHNNVANKIGGDAPLTQKGLQYSHALARYVSQQQAFQQESSVEASADKKSSNLSIWTSTLQRTRYVGDLFDPEKFEVQNIKFLNEIYGGIFEGWSFGDVEKKHPEEYYARQKNKLLYRYPGSGGESYLDVIERLRPVIIEIERMESDLLVVTHQVVLRTLLAYFAGISLPEMPNLEVPLHTLYRLTPMPYGAEIRRYAYNFEKDEFDFLGDGLPI